MPKFVMMASHDNDGDYIERSASHFSILSSPYKRLRLMPREDEDGDIEMADSDEMEADEAKDAGSPDSLLSKTCTAANAFITSAVASTIRKFTSTCTASNVGVHIEDPARSLPDVKEDLYPKCEEQGIEDSVLAGSCSISEPARGPPISLRDHASLHPVAPRQSFEKTQEGHGDDIPLGTLKSLLTARQHLEDARERIIANAASKWIDFPEKSACDNAGSRSGTEQRTFEQREDPKKVLMEVLYPGEGKRILDRIDEVGNGVGKKDKGRPWTMQRKAGSLLGDWKL